MEKYRKQKAFTLIEVMMASVMLMITVLGGLSYKYNAVKQMRRAWANMTAMRLGQMVLEDWKSTGGKPLGTSNGYNPSYFDDTFTKINDSNWKITVEELPMRVQLNCQNVETDSNTGITLKKITVLVRWRADLEDGPVDGDSPSMKLETYSRTDMQGG